MTQAYCEVWQGGRRVGSALYDCGRIAPMQPYRDPRMQHRVIVPAPPVREYARDSCTPSRYNALTRNRYADNDLDGWGDEFDGWDGDIPEEEPLPEPVRRAPPPAPVVVEPLPVAVPNWPRRPAVVEAVPEAVPVVVNHTAARFGALEIRR
jgi:hypothetical protein